MFLGIDLGTSSVKALVLDEAGSVLAQGSAPLDVMQPRPLWSEQDPEQWWLATGRAVHEASSQLAGGLRGLVAIGLSGQMHGATVLDAADRPLRPAILWNDGRSQAQCTALERAVPTSRSITGNLAMPGFTAPKILWLRDHEPAHHAAIAQVLLPKDYLRLRLTGDHASDLSDASGTLWLDVRRRAWSSEMLAACGLTRDQVPALFEGPEPTGRLRAEVAQAWGCERVPVVAGAGDPTTLNDASSLANALSMMQQFEESEAVATRHLEAGALVLPQNHPSMIGLAGTLGFTYLEQKNTDAAEPLLLGAHDGFAATFGKDSPYTLRYAQALVHLYELRGDAESAARYRRVPSSP